VKTFLGNQEEYEYLRKFSSNDDSVNHSSPTSTFQYPYVHSQIDKNGKKNTIHTIKLIFNDKTSKFLIKDYMIDEYYSPTRQNVTTSTVNYNNNVITNKSNMNLITGESVVPVVRVVKRRNTANKKERRRTQSINSAYSSLREHIPNVPSDTKLSKVNIIIHLNVEKDLNFNLLIKD
jgi:hypothetical protein